MPAQCFGPAPSIVDPHRGRTDGRTRPHHIDLERKSWAKVIKALRRKEADKATDEFLRMMRRVSKEVSRLFEQRGLFESVSDS